MKKRFCFACLILFLAGGLFSQEYMVNSGAAYTTAWVDTQITTLTGGNWDEGYYDLALPSSNQFYFYGKKVTHLRIMTNGYVALGFGSPSGACYITNEPIPDASTPQSYVAPWWDDWDLSYGGEIWYALYSGGSGSSNWVTIEWRNVAHWLDPSASYDFQVIFFGEYNSTDTPAGWGSILLNYMDTDSGTGTYDFGKSGTVGIEHYTGYQGEQFSYNSASLNNSLQILLTPYIPIYDMTDGWADGDPDPVVFRVDDGQGYFFYKDNGGNPNETHVWGTLNDIPVPGDYNGDGYWNPAIFRPSSGMWFTTGGGPHYTVQWGTEGDIPVPADYDGDGDTDLAVYRPKSGLWFIYYMPAGTTTSVQFGMQGDLPVAADYDNDGLADIAVYRPSNGVWYIRKSSNPAQMYSFAWGAEGDIPMPANFQTSAYSTACVYRPSNGQWYSYNQQTAGTQVLGSWGLESDVPVPNDWNGGGVTDRCVFRPSNGVWYSTYAGDFQWGQLGDKPRCRFSSLIVAPHPVGAPGITDPTGRPLNQQ
jgi:hypothetical protein